MEKLAILAMLVLMLSAPAIAWKALGSDDSIAMVRYVDNVNEPKTIQYRNLPVNNNMVKEIMVIEEPIIEVMVEENGTLKCAKVLEDCFRTPCCSGLRCDLGIHARCV